MQVAAVRLADDVAVLADELAAHIDQLIVERCARARAVTLESVDSRPLPVKLRDGAARLFSPFL